MERENPAEAVTSQHVPTLSPSTVAKYINLHQCGRFLHLKNVPSSTAADGYAHIVKASLDPELQAAGAALEVHVQTVLDTAGVLSMAADQSAAELSWDDFTAGLAQLRHGQWAYGREVVLCAHVNGLGVILNGRADFIMLRWAKDGTPVLRVVECKASKEPQTMHLTQVRPGCGRQQWL